MWPISENLAEGLIKKRIVYKTMHRIKGDLMCNLSTTLAWLRIADMKETWQVLNNISYLQRRMN